MPPPHPCPRPAHTWRPRPTPTPHPRPALRAQLSPRPGPGRGQLPALESPCPLCPSRVGTDAAWCCGIRGHTGTAKGLVGMRTQGKEGVGLPSPGQRDTPAWGLLLGPPRHHSDPAHPPGRPGGGQGTGAQPPPGTSAVQGLGWKKPGSRLIRPDLRNTITSFKTKQLPARAFLPEPPEQPHPRGDRPEETQETVSLRTQARWCTRVHACLGACTHVHACLGACTRWKQFAASHPPARGTVASSPGKGGGHHTRRGPAGSSLGWIRGAQSHDPPRAHPHFPSARRMPGGGPRMAAREDPCRAVSHGWRVTLDILMSSRGPCWPSSSLLAPWPLQPSASPLGRKEGL